MTQFCTFALSLSSIITLSSLYAIFALPTILGNGVFLWVIFKSRSLRTISNLLVSSLALADFFVGLVIDPVWIARCIISPRARNHPLDIAIGCLWIQTSITTTFSLSVVSLDRYIAVRSALQYNQIMTYERCRVAVTFVWIASLTSAFSRLWVRSPAMLPILWACVTGITILLPMMLIIFCYYRIFVLARRQSRKIATQTLGFRAQFAAEGVRNRKTAKTVGYVVALFIISWLPSLIVSFVELTSRDNCTKPNMELVWLWVELIAFTSSGINPWLYSMRSNAFRNEMKRVFRMNRLRSSRIMVAKGKTRSEELGIDSQA
ncbi:histamine H2 receptor-like [Montipora foliosa]|uniref:histamine H2 receptor-like n=1 Tax=Montipora foliosa TaxID=591990 RepID=UPI0035F111D1